jgi:crotonobetainyl-CoA:carnitine CoA-transferase CaiB-like acyl-CoA transferase
MEGGMGQRAKMSSEYERLSFFCGIRGVGSLPLKPYPCAQNDAILIGAVADKAYQEARSILAETEPSIDYATFYVPINGGCYVADDEMQSALAESLAAFVGSN